MSRQKGNAAEREICRLLEAWWQQVEPGCRFVRTPLSGGWGGPDIRAGFNASGDLMTTAERFPWCCEVKRREAWTFERLIDGKPSPVWGWWRQAQKAALEVRKEPALFFRRNRGEWLLILPWRRRHGEVIATVQPVFVWQRLNLKANVGALLPVLYELDAVLASTANRFAATPRG